MKRNGVLIMYLLLLVLLILIAAWLKMHQHPEAAKFILSALTALGTCGVVFLTVWPYKPQDKLSAVLYNEPDDPLFYRIKVTNQTDHTICLGLRKDYTPYPDNIFLWWPTGVDKIYEKAVSLWSVEGDILSIPPKCSAFYHVDKRIFAKENIKNIRMQVQTNTGYKCDVVNRL
ncbi:MAG: hypothetical protein IKO56_10065 [Alphaproteobacteria bacterium]|nr:hypothetical protein [Alphaproteobacteria bacterium]MBR6364404.1 hypothetical protein [Alphaproteobacteria bacterium]